jgi:secreted Zn-dependent insulinase-like peptidase
MFIEIISQDVEDECTQTEKWYATKYQAVDIDVNQLNGWRDAGLNKDILHIPPENPYIAEDFSLFCDKDSSNNNNANQQQSLTITKIHTYTKDKTKDIL